MADYAGVVMYTGRRLAGWRLQLPTSDPQDPVASVPFVLKFGELHKMQQSATRRVSQQQADHSLTLTDLQVELGALIVLVGQVYTVGHSRDVVACK
jgi:hypothetical protein